MRLCGWRGCGAEVLGRGSCCGRKCANKLAVDKRRRALKAAAVEMAGGACSRCGYNKCLAALEFHHRDPAGKSFAISAKGYTRSLAEVLTEIAKCDLLCANCHREVEHDKIHAKHNGQ